MSYNCTLSSLTLNVTSTAAPLCVYAANSSEGSIQSWVCKAPSFTSAVPNTLYLAKTTSTRKNQWVQRKERADNSKSTQITIIICSISTTTSNSRSVVTQSTVQFSPTETRTEATFKIEHSRMQTFMHTIKKSLSYLRTHQNSHLLLDQYSSWARLLLLHCQCQLGTRWAQLQLA